VKCSFCDKEIKSEKELGNMWHDGCICKQCTYDEENHVSDGRNAGDSLMEE
jgi:hypothetical protein